MLLEPSFASFQDFIAMGKHGAYVWSTYGLAVLILGINLWSIVNARKKVIADIKRSIKRDADAGDNSGNPL